MFTERVKSSFATNEPIYTEEIIGLSPIIQDRRFSGLYVKPKRKRK